MKVINWSNKSLELDILFGGGGYSNGQDIHSFLRNGKSFQLSMYYVSFSLGSFNINKKFKEFLSQYK